MERLVLVHGSVRNGDFAWAAQEELAASFELVVLNRPGFPPNPPEDRVDFEEHGRWVAERLRPGDHLCGHSYGAVVSLFAAEVAHDLRSLIVIEPPAFGLATDDPQVAAYAERQKEYWATGPREPRAFLAGFYELAGRRVDLPDVLPADLLQGAHALLVQRGPWEAQPSFSKIMEHDPRTLVVSGGWSSVFESVCDVVAARLGAERRVYQGAGHNVQNADGFNAGLLRFLERSAREHGSARWSESRPDPVQLPGVVTEMTCQDVIEVLAALDAGGIDYWVDGGWGIDALVGEQTRRHHDLDLGVSRDDVARIEALLPQFRRESEDGSFYRDKRGRAVDLMLVERSQGGQFEQQLPEGGRLRYAESETHASGCIGGRLIRCATAALQREHRNHPNATDQDRRDVEVLEQRGERTGSSSTV